MLEINTIHLGNCLELMKSIESNSIDMILTDLPYGTTRLSWDSVIDLKLLWSEYKRIIKQRGTVALFGNQPFSSLLVTSAIELYKYSWYWIKSFPTGFLNANYRPMLAIEEILIFSKSGAGAGSKSGAMSYYPQGLIEVNRKKVNKKGKRGQHIHNTINCGNENVLNSDRQYEQKFTNYPKNILEFGRDMPQVHPTQKPVGLCDYLIRTYTNESDLVLDSCSGSGTTAIACLNTNRNYICIELDENYHRISVDRASKWHENKREQVKQMIRDKRKGIQ